jgi:hypothetical protein
MSDYLLGLVNSQVTTEVLPPGSAQIKTPKVKRPKDESPWKSLAIFLSVLGGILSLVLFLNFAKNKW